MHISEWQKGMILHGRAGVMFVGAPRRAKAGIKCEVRGASFQRIGTTSLERDFSGPRGVLSLQDNAEFDGSTFT